MVVERPPSIAKVLTDTSFATTPVAAPAHSVRIRQDASSFAISNNDEPARLNQDRRKILQSVTPEVAVSEASCPRATDRSRFRIVRGEERVRCLAGEGSKHDSIRPTRIGEIEWARGRHVTVITGLETQHQGIVPAERGPVGEKMIVQGSVRDATSLLREPVDGHCEAIHCGARQEDDSQASRSKRWSRIAIWRRGIRSVRRAAIPSLAPGKVPPLIPVPQHALP
jgi:hypothetical protein